MKSGLYAGAALAAAALVAASSASAQSRDQIRIVGSSTVFPFTQEVAEQFAAAGDQGAGRREHRHRRRLQAVLRAASARASRTSPAPRARSRPRRTRTAPPRRRRTSPRSSSATTACRSPSRRRPRPRLDQGADLPGPRQERPGDGESGANPYKNWCDIDASLPNVKIEVYGPPPTSGTRDAFVELVMQAGCETCPWLAGLEEDPARRRSAPRCAKTALTSRRARTTT